MKKQVLAAAIVATMSMPAMAKFVDVYAGVDYGTNKTNFNGKSDTADNLSGYIAFEHFLPLIPNVKLKYSDLTNNDFSGNDSSAINGIFYYELLDTELVELDLGLVYTDIQGYREDAMLVQAYGAGKLYVPGVSMNAFAEVIAGSVTKDDALDAEIGLAYTFTPGISLLSVAVRGGYRIQELDFKQNNNTQKVKGLFAGVEVAF